LEALIKTDDGLKLAEIDLKLRGPGDFIGTRQWGIPDIAMESISDLPLVEKTREAAKEILEKDMELKKYPLLKQELEKFKGIVHLE
jgi:ATP-dependent DNA helicase RecG